MQNTYLTCGRVLSCGHALSKKLRNSLPAAPAAALALAILLTPPYARAAEREGTVLFFSVADLTQLLSHPTLPALPSLAALSPSRAWGEPDQAAEPDGPLERNARWGHGLGLDGYAYPGPRRSLWGF
jgi:hypothetical protein